VSSDSLYYRKHNPFISYKNIQTNSTRCAKIVAGTQLSTDISQGTLPTFAWYTSNIKNDGHDTDVTFAGNWLHTFLSSTGATSHFDVVLVTFDEDESDAPSNQVYTAIAGRAVTNAGTTDNTALNHYSVLKTLETNFGLGNLGENGVGDGFQFVIQYPASLTQVMSQEFKPPFVWQDPNRFQFHVVFLQNIV
jgi:hypothetical protein